MTTQAISRARFLARRSPRLVAANAVALAGVLYALLLPHMSGDAELWFVPWLDHIIDNGVGSSLSEPLPVLVEEADDKGNYTPPYLYVLSAASLAHGFLDSLAIVKLVAIAGAGACAAVMYLLLRRFVSKEQALIGAAGLLLLPTVMLNTAAWGQVDVFYTGFLLLTVLAAFKGNWTLMMLAFGAALAFKAQAVFIGPFLLYMVLSRRVPLWTLGLPVLVYAGSMAPAWLAGRPAAELLTIYADQADTYHRLSMDAPNPWAFVQYFNLLPYSVGVAIGLALAAIAGVGVAALAFRKRLEGRDLLLLAVTSTALMPYLMAKMHDRYFFPAEILAYALVIVNPRWWTVAAAVLLQLGSSSAYGSALWDFGPGEYPGAIFTTLAVAILLGQLLVAIGFPVGTVVARTRSGLLSNH